MDFVSELSFNKTFSQLAKESNFTFNLYRGRVDWKKIENLDVDRIVRDQDVELLNINISNVTNCNLESEYDTKILDPSFIKLFKLAQLLIDFLLHCKRYLEHCIKVAYESLQSSAKNEERFHQQLKIRKTEVKQLKKKLQDVKQKCLISPRFSSPTHKCSLCGKLFMNEKYCIGHQSRRHPSHSLAVSQQSGVPAPATPTENVISEMKTADNAGDVSNMKRKYQEEIEEMKNKFFSEIQSLKQKEIGEVIIKEGLTETVENVNIEIDTNEENKDPQKEHLEAEVGEEVWQQRIEEREGVWRARLADLDQQHKKQVQELQTRLNTSHSQGQEIKRELEKQIEEALNKLEQSQALLEKKIIANQEENKKLVDEEVKGAIQPSTVLKSSISTQTIEQKPVHQAPPIQKRKAFVSQKSKTIQEESSFESPKTTPVMETLVKQIQSDVESDSEVIPPQVKDSTWTNVEVAKSKPRVSTSPVLLGLSTKSETPSISKNKENTITKLLEEEKLIHFRNTQPKQDGQTIDNDESTTSETLTESEIESDNSEETKRDNPALGRQEIDSSDDQILQNETQLAKQSLESMESLLAANPDILCQLREDLQQLSKRRLQDLGVDPGWGGLPPSTFQNKMAVLAHQRSIAAKKHKVYLTLRDKLNRDAEAAVLNRPTQSTADTIMQRLRSKVALIVNAATFSHRLVKRTFKKQLSDEHKKIPVVTEIPAALVSSSPQSPLKLSTPSTSIHKQPLNVPKMLVTQSKDSLSLSSLTSEEENEEDRGMTFVDASPIPSTQVKSALRNAVSTGSLTKKKVLFVDQALSEEKRSKSESEVASNDSFATSAEPNTSAVSASVTDLVKEIQSQMIKRTGPPAFSVDLMGANPNFSHKKGEKNLSLPLSQILPLTKSGRELLETEEKLSMQRPVAPERTKKSTPLVTLKSVESNFLSSSSSGVTVSGRRGEGEAGGGKTLLKVSPSHSLTSLGSSLLDISVSPRTHPHAHTSSTLEWDLQDLEDNLRD